jgi:DNA-binding MarR family transcriptional regulator
VSEPETYLLGDTDYRDHADFRYAIRRFLRYSEKQARACGITPQQHMLLLIVRGHPSYPAVSIGEIAERLQLRHHSASLLVERCVHRDLLKREKDAVDRRRALVSLTDKGERILASVTQANKQELKALDDALYRLRGSLRQALRNSTVPSGAGAARHLD